MVPSGEYPWPPCPSISSLAQTLFPLVIVYSGPSIPSVSCHPYGEAKSFDGSNKSCLGPWIGLSAGNAKTLYWDPSFKIDLLFVWFKDSNVLFEVIEFDGSKLQLIIQSDLSIIFPVNASTLTLYQNFPLVECMLKSHTSLMLFSFKLKYPKLTGISCWETPAELKIKFLSVLLISSKLSSCPKSKWLTVFMIAALALMSGWVELIFSSRLLMKLFA